MADEYLTVLKFYVNMGSSLRNWLMDYLLPEHPLFEDGEEGSILNFTL